MLILSRRPNESIFIADDVVVTVLTVRGDRVKIGIEAPMEVPVHRKELYERIRGPDDARHVGGRAEGKPG